MKIIHTIAEFRAYRRSRAGDGGDGEGERGGLAAFVPTMGALHEGHAALVRRARRMADYAGRGGKRGLALASIFVNPTQFGPGEDFGRYPRTLDADVQLLAHAGCDAVFVPSAAEMYPEIQEMSTGHALLGTSIDPGPLANILEGAIRPGHFRGVCTVVAKLLNIVEPSHLLLGQEDYQQQAVLRLMCAELNMPVEVVTCETVREADGLAMSSRNRYLSAEERGRAGAIYQALTWARDAYLSGEKGAALLEAGMEQRLVASGLLPQYAVVADARTLKRFRERSEGEVNAEGVLLIAAKLGATRLIDNMLLQG
jgi:pantoate--beta-alanine ligase